MRKIITIGLSLIAMAIPSLAFAGEFTLHQAIRIACKDQIGAKEVLHVFAFEPKAKGLAVEKKIEAINAKAGNEVCSVKQLLYINGLVTPLLIHNFKHSGSPVEYIDTFGIVEIYVYGERDEEGMSLFKLPSIRYCIYFISSARV